MGCKSLQEEDGAGCYPPAQCAYTYYCLTFDQEDFFTVKHTHAQKQECKKQLMPRSVHSNQTNQTDRDEDND